MTRDPPHPPCAPPHLCPVCAIPMPDPPFSSGEWLQRAYEVRRARYVEAHPIIPIRGETPADLKARLAFEREVTWRLENPGEAYPW